MTVAVAAPAPFPQDPALIETPIMHNARIRVTAIHSQRGQFACLTGRSRAGKTTTAQWLMQQMNARYELREPKAFRAAFYETGPIRSGPADHQYKQAIRALYENVIVRQMDTAIYKGDRAVMARLTVTALMEADIQVVFIDEAGRQSCYALEGLSHVLNTAASMGWPLTIVLVGMHDLPLTIRELPQVMNRVRDTILFRSYTPDETLAFLVNVHPFFAALNPAAQETKELVTWFLAPEVSDGLPGLMVDIVERAARLAEMYGKHLSAALLRATQYMKVADTTAAERDSEQGFRGAPPLPPSLPPKRRRGRRTRTERSGVADGERSSARPTDGADDASDDASGDGSDDASDAARNGTGDPGDDGAPDDGTTRRV